MAKALFFVLACALFVAALAEYDEMDDETALDAEFMKRDDFLLDYFEAEKRGRGKNMKKYKACNQWGMSCWCQRRTNKIVYCTGAAGGENM